MFLLDEEQESKERKGVKQGEKQTNVTSGHQTLGPLLISVFLCKISHSEANVPKLQTSAIFQNQTPLKPPPKGSGNNYSLRFTNQLFTDVRADELTLLAHLGTGTTLFLARLPPIKTLRIYGASYLHFQ